MKFSFAKMIDPSLLLSPARSIRSYSDVSLLSLCYLCFLIVWLFGERQVSDTAIIMTFMAAVFLAHTFVMNRLFSLVSTGSESSCWSESTGRTSDLLSCLP